LERRITKLHRHLIISGKDRKDNKGRDKRERRESGGLYGISKET